MTRKSEAKKEVDRLYAICCDLEEQLRVAEEELRDAEDKVFIEKEK